MKQAWQDDLEQDESDPRIQAILDCLFVIGITAVCAALFGLVLGLIWPHVERWM